MKKKYIILVGDGMADRPVASLDNRTPLEYAQTPAMNTLAKSGIVRLVATVPEGYPPGSDVANLSLMGYDPQVYYSGRAPIEAASLGLPLSSDDTAFRCNLVKIINETMIDYSAGHIDTGKASRIIKALATELDDDSIRFYPGISYRHIVVIKNFPDGLTCTPPHDITDTPTTPHLPRGNGAEKILSLLKKARTVIHDFHAAHPDCLTDATDIWLWGQGRALQLPHLKDRFGLNGSVISAVDLVRGLGVLAGLTVRLVDGATGYLGTNYAGKVQAAIDALKNEDFVYLHVEAPDETSHQGDLQKKIQAIEEFDHYVVKEIMHYQKEHPELTILVAPDHATPVSLKTHSSEPVPFLVSGSSITADNSCTYCESSAQGKPIYSGPELFEHFIRGF
ncbi:MAG: cofactor-independent phosphoglycerate mutase [Fibrobacter sp.]|nr:cofactor-independent phosphoglycerate mutase [Fibrobacter sp.]